MLLLNGRSYKWVAAMLKSATDKAAPPAQEAPILLHANIRGRNNYNSSGDIVLIHPIVERLRALGLAAMTDTLRTAHRSRGRRYTAPRLARPSHR